MTSEVDVRIGYGARMSSGAVPSASDIVGGLSLLAARLETASAKGPLLALRERLVGELLGDSERAIAPLDDDFCLVTHVGGNTIATDRDGVAGSLRGLAAREDHLMWVELAELVSDDRTVAGHGALCSMSGVPPVEDTAGPTGRVSVSRMPFAFFVGCDDDRMTSETVFLDADDTELTEHEGTVADVRDGLAAAVGAHLAS